MIATSRIRNTAFMFIPVNISMMSKNGWKSKENTKEAPNSPSSTAAKAINAIAITPCIMLSLLRQEFVEYRPDDRQEQQPAEHGKNIDFYGMSPVYIACTPP